MIFMSVLFILDFIISIAALALNEIQQHQLLKNGFESLSKEDKIHLQENLHCCNFDNATTASLPCPSVSINIVYKVVQ